VGEYILPGDFFAEVGDQRLEKRGETYCHYPGGAKGARRLFAEAPWRHGRPGAWHASRRACPRARGGALARDKALHKTASLAQDRPRDYTLEDDRSDLSGLDANGLATRLFNMLIGIDGKISGVKNRIAEVKAEFESAESTIGRPSKFEQELNEKVAHAANRKWK
jgi:hypothetical protein